MKASTKAIRFLESLAIPEGPKAGEKIKLAPFQKKFVKGALADGVQVAVLSIGRGNAKTALSAGIALGAVMGKWDTQPRREILIAARTRDQARIAFDFVVGFMRSLSDEEQAQFTVRKSDGWKPWPNDVRAEFEKAAPPRARLVYELCIGTGQRIGDVLKMRWDHIKNNEIDVTQGKGDKPLLLPLTDRLAAFLAQVDKTGLTVVTSAHGRPASYRAVADEMRKVKAEMEHPDASRYVTHGLRKNATIELYQAGCDDEMVKAITGHSSVEMLKKYGGAVRQIGLARQAQEARNRSEQNKTRT